MRTLLALLAPAAVLALAGPAAPDPPVNAPAPVTLSQAVASGQVTARGEKPSGYASVHVVLTNRTPGPLSVDLCGSYLRPRTPRSCQRLGLGPPASKDAARGGTPGTVVVDLGPGETRTVETRSCCLDVRLPVPSSHTFSVAHEPAPPAAERVLRWWADHPETPQGVVNSAIWRGQDTVEWKPSARGVASNAWDPGNERAVASRGGVVYQVAQGRLTSLDAEGVRRALGSQVRRVLPTDDALYAVWMTGSRTGELRRLAMTGEDDDAWEEICPLGEDTAVVAVHPLGKDGVLVLTDEAVRWVATGSKRAADVGRASGGEPPSVHVGERGRVTLVTNRARRSAGVLGVLGEFRPSTGLAHGEEEFWDLKTVRAGPAGVFGLTHVGRLVRVEGKATRPVDDVRDGAAILAVGRRVVWIESRDGKPVAADAESGAITSRPDAQAMELQVALDEVTGDLVVAGRLGWARWRREGHAVEAIPAP